MDTASVVFGCIVGAVFATLAIIMWVCGDDRPIVDQFRELPDTPEQRARSAGL
ncbi:MAG: hypothetical protein JWL86_620 [Rhizobium sp.]|nr:hypothetical protein [Rhizobium sp.]